MERRRKNNILIGVLCCTLIFMGFGYAILSSVLTINSTANIAGDFNIHFLNDDQNKKGISLIDYPASQTAGSTVYNTTVTTKATLMEADTLVDSQDPTQATFSAILQKPTDYAIFTVTVKNYGTIDGYLTFSFEDTNNNFSYYDDFYSVEFIKEGSPNITADILQGDTFTDSVVLSSGESREYKIKVTFKESATNFPDPTYNNVGDFECAINLTYSQNAPAQSQNAGVSNGWEVDSNGKVIAYDPADLVNGTLTVPATTGPNGTGDHIVSIGKGSIVGDYNVIEYETDEDNYALITDQTNYEILSGFINVKGYTLITDISDIPSGEEIKDTYYLNLDTTISVQDFDEKDDWREATASITTLDLSGATYLTTIDDNAFSYNLIENIVFNNSLTTIGVGAFGHNNITGALVIPSSVQTIDEDAFCDNHITSLTISSGVVSIGRFAFEDNDIATLNLSNATSLTSISNGAFEKNYLTTIDLSHTNLTYIGSGAFGSQYDFNNNNNSTLTSINASNKTKAQYDTISRNTPWYDDSNANFHITYSDQCVGVCS